IFTAPPNFAAEEIAFRYSIFEESLPVKDLRTYAETQKASSTLKQLLGFLSPEERVAVQQILQVKLPLNIVTLDKVLDTGLGKKILSKATEVNKRRDYAGVQALRAASILGTITPGGGLSVISLLEAYPSQRITIDVGQVPELIAFIFGGQNSNDRAKSVRQSEGGNRPTATSSQQLFNNNLSSAPWWQLAVTYQDIDTQTKQYSGCLFGDSISSGLGNTLGMQTYNFALPGMSTVSLVEQLKTLNSAKVKCQKAIIAIGTNDALYGTSDALFVKKMNETITLVQSLGAKQVVLIPAFYSTVAASQNPILAGPIPRVEEINALIRQVAATGNVPVAASGIQPLFKDRALKENLTVDGVHLNAAGIEIYRQVLLKIFDTPQ
ncbi:MAG: alpha/beta hydrolase, partial [Chroococcidiopsidaceae cyanobacterium CP_BM_RX_35]|nr:alpha/beta hydrolase [Chroococcidiopsidaceae cyanobacterium CP_BM_RX_35]